MDDISPFNTERVYQLLCYVKKIKLTFKDTLAYGKMKDVQQEEECIVLIPENNDEGIKFWMAWLPQDYESQGKYEVPSWIDGPIHSPARLAVMLPNKQCDKNHLFLMTPALEDKLKKFVKDGSDRRLAVKIFPASEDNICDTMPTVVRDLRK